MDEDYPVFTHFILQPDPEPTGKMKYTGGYYASMYGRIESSWEIKNNVCHYSFVIPANTTATLYLNALSANDITNAGKALRAVKGIKYIGLEKGKHVFELPSGRYDIQVNDKPKKSSIS